MDYEDAKLFPLTYKDSVDCLRCRKLILSERMEVKVY